MSIVLWLEQPASPQGLMSSILVVQKQKKDDKARGAILEKELIANL